jgi:hypothetical protein
MIMNVVMIIPTGIGCEIGGHAGDATPVAKLIGACCNKIILHPNVVNASDINEMPENALYVEGSILDRFLESKIELEEVYSNDILVVTNPPIKKETINAVSAARATIGANIDIVVLNKPLQMIVKFENGKATGDVFGWRELIKQVEQYEFDALAISSVIDCPFKVALNYFKKGGVNPWGGVEAKTSRLIATELNVPVAHAPVEPEGRPEELQNFNDVVDPRISAEVISTAYLHCVLKGLHKAPRIMTKIEGKSLGVEDVDCLVSPFGCIGRPHYACEEAGIPIIIVRENTCVLKQFKKLKKQIYVENYLEAVGVIMAMQAGIHPESIRRPLEYTKVLNA